MPGLDACLSRLHPQIQASAELVGRENVIAATNSRLGGRIHPQIAYANQAKTRLAELKKPP
jgi:hypothetical protein